MKMIGDTAIAFLLQTPSFAVDLVNQALKSIKYPEFEERE